MIGENVYGLTYSTEIIKVGINEGEFVSYNVVENIENALNGYIWIVGDKEYKFETHKINVDDILDDILIKEDFNVHIIDGATDEAYICGVKLCKEDEECKDKLEEFITEKGGGYIGRCLGAWLPAHSDENEPEGIFQYYFCKQNAFLRETTDIQAHAKYDWILTSQFFKMRYGKWIRPIPFWRGIGNRAPEATGNGAYDMYASEVGIHYSTNIRGICLDFTNLGVTHPILNGYFGDTLYMRMEGGPSYPNPPKYADVLACFPSDCYENEPKHLLNIWECKPIGGLLTHLRELLSLAEDSSIGIIDIDDLPSEWQDLFEKGQEKTDIVEMMFYILSKMKCWYKLENEYIETELPGNPAILAFEYPPDSEDSGRVVLCGPHPASKIWTVDTEIKNEDDENGKARSIGEGLFHWLKTDTGEILKSTELVENENLWWYQRREAAWAAKVPDDSLPPIYGRSQVVEISPYMQITSEFPIKCCVAKEPDEEWDEHELKLYYKHYSSSNWSNNEWQYYGSIYSKPYIFNFDASEAMGDGLYRFCSVLKTTKNDVDTVDDFPPGWDAEVYVNGIISAQFTHDKDYPYAKDSISFNSSESSTKPGTEITSYHWEFGDGENSTEVNPTHTYDDEGVYTVKLTIENNLSQTNYTNKTITIHNNPPEMNINSDCDVIFVTDTVNFTDTSSDIDGNITSWFWDFGDGTNSTVRNTSHTYTNNGYYQFSLEVTDDDNTTNRTIGEVLVIDSLVNQTRSQQNNIWNSIQDAVDNASTNDLIYIDNGTYSENITINRSITIIGENKNNVTIKGSIVMNNPYDYELPTKETFDYLIVNNMTDIEFLMHFNNDSDVGENYSISNLIVDYSGEGNNGTNNCAVWTTSTIKGEGAFDFDGIDDSINLTSISGLIGENTTISAWINLDEGNGTEYPILSQINSTSGYCLFVNNSTMKPCFKLDNEIAISSNTIGCNEWHYIVGTHNETVLKVYIDGKLTGTFSKTGTGCDTLGFIGFENNSNYFDGRIDEVAIWNRTLADDEINLIFESNNGIYIEGVTFKDSNVGIIPCNHSRISYCNFVNHTVGVLFNNSCDVRIHMCNISDVNIGVKIIDSNPVSFYYNRIVDCIIDNVYTSVMVNGSSNLNIIGCIVNGSESNLSFSNCDMENISVIDSWSPNNVAPDIPDLSGPSQGDINTSYTFYSYTNDSNNDYIDYYFDWGDGNSSGWINPGSSMFSNYYYASHKWMAQGGYYVKTKSRDIFDFESNWSAPILFRTENLTPIIKSVNDSPDPTGFGFDVTITANVTDDSSGNYSGIKTVKANISYPDDTFVNVSMSDVGNNTYRYVFSDTWTVGQYDYCIWAIDNAYNTNTSMDHSFNVSVDATISVCTINNSYTSNCTVNLTDPPSSSYLVGYELIDNGKVLHIWNNLDNYYFNTSSGIQITNHYNEYWSHNVLMLGYYDNDEWNLIYRTDELSGFNKDIECDNETYVNITLWKNLKYAGYDFRLAIRYHLGIDDNGLIVIPYIKNIDNEDIPYVLGFAWEIKDIRIDMTTEDDYIDINGTTYYLNTSGLNETYKNMDNSCFYIREDIGDKKSESLYLRWDEDLNYKVWVKSRDGQYNAPVTLGIKIGTLSVGQEKQTKIFWYDACQTTYPYNSYDTMFAWASNPSNMVDGNTSNYASTAFNLDVEILNGNVCSGTDLGTISKVEIRAFGKYSGGGVPPVHDIILRAVGGMHIFSPSTTGAWSNWYDITNNPSAPSPWTWNDVKNLIVEVEASIFGMYTLYCSKVEIQVTYNMNPGIYNPFPTDGANGITITPVLNISVSDADGDTMNITWLSNSSGSWQVFGTNNSIGNGTYHQTFSNATVNGQWWYWKVNVSDGTNYKESDVFSFYTGYQSKIENTGSTNFTGYLLMQIEFYNTTNSTWIFEQIVVNETTPRTINISDVLGLDTIFNAQNVSTSSFTIGDGTYRIYAAFRNPDGDVLVCDDESLLEASYQFTVSSS